MTTLTSQLQALHELHVAGMLTDEQFTRAKTLILVKDLTGVGPGPGADPSPPLRPPPSPSVVRPVVPGVGLALGAAAVGGG